MSNDEMIVCYVCNLSEENEERVLECVQCCRSTHVECLNISGKVIKKAKKRNHYCSALCSEIFARNVNKSVGYEDMVNEIRSLASVIRDVKNESAKINFSIEQTRQEMSQLVETTRKIEQSQEFLSIQFEKLKFDVERFNQDLRKMREENMLVRKEVEMMHEQQQQLEEKVEKLEADLEKVQRESLVRNAVFLGLPMVEGENTKELILKVGTAIKMTLQPEDITGVRRLMVRYYCDDKMERRLKKSAANDNCKPCWNLIRIIVSTPHLNSISINHIELIVQFSIYHHVLHSKSKLSLPFAIRLEQKYTS